MSVTLCSSSSASAAPLATTITYKSPAFQSALEAIGKAENAISTAKSHQIRGRSTTLKRSVVILKENKPLNAARNAEIIKATEELDNLIVEISKSIFLSFFSSSSSSKLNVSANSKLLEDQIAILRFLFKKKNSILHFDKHCIGCHCARHLNAIEQIAAMIKPKPVQITTISDKQAPSEIEQLKSRIRDHRVRGLLLSYFFELRKEFLLKSEDSLKNFSSVQIEALKKFQIKHGEFFSQIGPFIETEYSKELMRECQTKKLIEAEFQNGNLSHTKKLEKLNNELKITNIIKAAMNGNVEELQNEIVKISNSDLFFSEVFALHLLNTLKEKIELSVSINNKQIACIKLIIEVFNIYYFQYSLKAGNNMQIILDITKLLGDAGIGFFHTEYELQPTIFKKLVYLSEVEKSGQLDLIENQEDHPLFTALLNGGFNFNTGNSVYVNDISKVLRDLERYEINLACLRIYFGALDRVCTDSESVKKLLKEHNIRSKKYRDKIVDAVNLRQSFIFGEMDSEVRFRLIDNLKPILLRDIIPIIKEFMVNLSDVQIAQKCWELHCSNFVAIDSQTEPIDDEEVESEEEIFINDIVPNESNAKDNDESDNTSSSSSSASSAASSATSSPLMTPAASGTFSRKRKFSALNGSQEGLFKLTLY